MGGVDEGALRQLLVDVGDGAVSADEAVHRLRRLPFADLGFAKVDHHRALRQGLPEAVYGPGKTPTQCAAIVAELLAEPDGGPVVLTRASEEQVAAATTANADGLITATGQGLSIATWRAAARRTGRVVVVTAGTADLPVAAECVATLRSFGIEPVLSPDCGVAGAHRLLATLDEVSQADAVIAIAGMEGALASLVTGLTAAPVIAVPTSPGYGAGLDGVTALLAMHASCASGLSVVGIDNGYGAACAVARILR